MHPFIRQHRGKILTLAAFCLFTVAYPLAVDQAWLRYEPHFLPWLLTTALILVLLWLFHLDQAEAFGRTFIRRRGVFVGLLSTVLVFAGIGGLVGLAYYQMLRISKEHVAGLLAHDSKAGEPPTEASPLLWPQPMPIKYGTPLSNQQLNATALVEGTYVYNPDYGTVLPEGTHDLTVVFKPTDAKRYASSSKTVSLRVIPPPASLASTPPYPQRSTKIEFRGVNAIEFDESGAATLPVLIYTSGTGTVHFLDAAHTHAFSPVPETPEAAIQQEDEFWAEFENGVKPYSNSQLVVSEVPNQSSIVHIPLGTLISTNMPTLRSKGGVIYVAIRFQDPDGKLIEQTCLAVNPLTTHFHLCSRHNIP